jgi:hypothetical protein
MTSKQDRLSLEPLQQDVERMIEKLQEEKGKIEKMHAECRTSASRAHYNAECGEAGRAENQVKEKFTHLEKVFHELQLAIQSVN